MKQQLSVVERVRRRRRRLLTGCAVTLGVILVLILGGWWLIANHLGALVSNLVRERASESINGRLEFSSLDVDLGGHAVMKDVAVYQAGSDEAVFRCPSAAVSFDFLTFVGPNRGKRAVVVNLSKPWLRLVREQDGGFNLSHLIKQREQEEEELTGVSVRLHDATVDFTDQCLLAQGYPHLNAPKGLAADVLKELGYDELAPAATDAHSETLGVDGSINYNPQRDELGIDLDVERDDGGKITVHAGGDSAFTGYEVSIDASGIQFASLPGYVHSIFPKLELGQAGDAPLYAQGPAYLSGGLQDAQLTLNKQSGQAVEWSLTADCMDSRFVSATLPALHFPQLKLDYNPPRHSASADLKLDIPGLEVSGKPHLALADNKLSGKLTVSATDIAKLAQALKFAEPPVSGSVSGSVTLAGTTGDPDIRLDLSGGQLTAGEFKLGTPAGGVSLAANKVSLDRVRTTGGDVALSANGSYDVKQKSGHFEVAAEELDIQRLIALAKNDKSATPELLKDAKGKVRLASIMDIKDGKPQGTLRAWASSLTASGYRVADVEAKGAYEAPNINLDSVTGKLSLPQPLDLWGFTSPEPLATEFRIGGSVSYMEGSPLVLALIGTAKTLNMAPDQADINFKAIGPANDPELRVQLKTSQADNPLTVSASGHYRKGMAPFTARLTWAETNIDIAGDANLPGRQIDARLEAKAVRIERFASDKRLSGTASVTATLKGAFDNLEIAGGANLPSLRFALPSKTYEISDAACGFKVVGKEAASISDGRLTFNGQPFTFAGTLGRERGSITLQAAKFDLFSALAAIPVGQGVGPQRLQINSSGQFTAVISGEVANPTADVTYDSGPGSVEGHKFTSAALRASVTRSGALVERLEIVSAQGSAAAHGSFGYNPVSYKGTVDVSSFDVAILTPVIAPNALSTLTGTLDGKMSISGTPQGYSASGDLTLTDGSLKGIPLKLAEARLESSKDLLEIKQLHAEGGGGEADAKGTIGFNPLRVDATVQASGFDVQLLTSMTQNKLLASLTGKFDAENVKLGYGGTDGGYTASGTVRLKSGSFHGVPVDKAEADLSTTGDRLKIERATVTSQGSTMTASGTLGKTLAESTLHISAPKVDVALFQPFMPDSAPELSGSINLKADATPAPGEYPAINITVQDSGQGLTAGPAHFSSIALNASLKQGVLTVTQCDLAANGNTFRVGGTYKLGEENPPLDLWASAKNFSLQDLGGLLPRGMSHQLPSGSLNFDKLVLEGTLQSPLLSGEIGVHLTGLPDTVPLNIADVTATVTLTQNDFDLPKTPVTFEHEGVRSEVLLSGGGQFSLVPFALTGGSITAELAPGGKPARIRYSGLFSYDGYVSGKVDIRAPNETERNAYGDRAILDGNVVIGGEGLNSTIWIRTAQEVNHEASLGMRLHLNELKVFVERGTEIRYSPIDLRAAISTEEGPLVVSGVPGLQSGIAGKPYADEVKICGKASLTKGSMFMYFLAHTVRFEGDSNVLRFPCQPGELIPYLSGSAVTVLPRVLQGEAIQTTPGLPTSLGAERGDLKVILGFNNILLAYLEQGGSPEDSASGASAGGTVGEGGKPIGRDSSFRDLTDISITSEPPRSRQEILSYLTGRFNDLAEGRTQINEFAQSEAYSYGTGFISRALEDRFNFEAFRFGGTGSEDNPFFVDMEKDVSDKLTFTYYRDFFNQTGQSEEFGLRYNILKGEYGGNLQNLDLSVNFQQSGLTGPEREFMFEWSVRLGKKRKPQDEEPVDSSPSS